MHTLLCGSMVAMHAEPLNALVMQALRVLQRVRGTDNVQLEYEDIATASKVAAQVLAHPMPCKSFCYHC